MREAESFETEFNPETEAFEQMESFEWSGESSLEVLGEAETMELAAELLEVRDEQELDRFLGKLIRKVGSVAGKVIRSPIGKAIGGVLKGVAKQALPIAGGALGTLVGGPVGTALGRSLGSMAGQALGLELEGLSQEDREFEGAKQFVRLASDAVNRAASASPSVGPGNAAQSAMAAAAQRYAPNLLGKARSRSSAGAAFRHSGRWYRDGRNIVVING